MNVFQIVGVSTAVLMACVTALQLARHREQTRMRLLLTLIWLAAAGAILRPDLSMRLANAVGIGRGADLLLYVAILASLIVWFTVYLRLVSHEKQLTEVVRHLAIAEARRTHQAPGESEGTAAPRDS